jgi:hypothetical protein
MARTTAPLLSWSASGQIAQTQVYSRWKGRGYVRRYVIPANPNTADQQETRNTFKWLNNFARYLPAGSIDAWTLYAANAQITERNAIIKQNLSNLRSQADLNNLIMSPSAGGGLVAAAIALTPGSAQISVALTAPTLPTGWTIVEAWAMAIRDQDPQTGLLYTTTADSVAAPGPYTIVLTGLTASQLYQVGGWFVFQKPDLTFAYGVAILDQDTPT